MFHFLLAYKIVTIHIYHQTLSLSPKGTNISRSENKNNSMYTKKNRPTIENIMFSERPGP